MGGHGGLGGGDAGVRCEGENGAHAVCNGGMRVEKRHDDDGQLSHTAGEVQLRVGAAKLADAGGVHAGSNGGEVVLRGADELAVAGVEVGGVASHAGGQLGDAVLTRGV